MHYRFPLGCFLLASCAAPSPEVAVRADGLSAGCHVDGSPAECCVSGQSIVEGTPAPDVFAYAESDDEARCVFGRGNRDIVRTSAGDDHVMLGPGADRGEGRAGDDLLFGGSGNDALYGDGGNDHLFGDDGDDLASGGRGLDELNGGAGSDDLRGDAESDRLVGDAGNDTLDGGHGDDWLYPGEGRDDAQGGEGDDVIVAYDLCELEAGERVVGGDGYDRFYSPLSRRELSAHGVYVDVEEIVVIPPSCLSPCTPRCVPPSDADYVSACEAACSSAIACLAVDGLDGLGQADCIVTCADAAAPLCGARDVLDAQLRCLTGSCDELVDCEVPSCE